jgi:hypothetical protein
MAARTGVGRDPEIGMSLTGLLLGNNSDRRCQGRRSTFPPPQQATVRNSRPSQVLRWGPMT